MESIAVKTGHCWKSLWNHPENLSLKKLRRDPNVLLPNDTIYVPKIEPKYERYVTGRRHRFVRNGVPSRLRIRVMRAGRARAFQPYELRVDGATYTGITDAEGWIEAPISPQASQGELIVGDNPLTRYLCDINLGAMDPITEVTGVQKRLQNLGYSCEVTGEIDDQTADALSDFQKAVDLEPTGELDQVTSQKLQEAYGC
jgi:hypothetical protein